MNRHERRKAKRLGPNMDEKQSFVMLTADFKKSPAYRAASLTARRILDCMEIEYMRCHGQNNGELVMTGAMVRAAGINHRLIPAGMREVQALLLCMKTQQGRAGNAAWRRPNKFNITYLPTFKFNGSKYDTIPATDEWRQITEDDAQMIAKGARRQGSNSAAAGRKPTTQKNRKPSPLSGPITSDFRAHLVGLYPSPLSGPEETNSPSPLSGPIIYTAVHLTAAAEGPEPSPVQQPKPKPAPKPEPKRAEAVAVNGHVNGATPLLSVKANARAIAEAEAVLAKLIAERDRLNGQRSLMPADDERLRQLVSEVSNLQMQIKTAKLMV
jgi:hypothetical protein